MRGGVRGGARQGVRGRERITYTTVGEPGVLRLPVIRCIDNFHTSNIKWMSTADE